MNKVIMMARLTKDPEVRYSSGEKSMAIARFTIAVNRSRKVEGQPEADFFNCTCFSKRAEFVEKYLHKGTKIVLEGELQNDNYTNKDGQKIYGMQIIVSAIEFAESKAAASATPAPAPAPTPASAAGDEFMSIPEGIDEELPFS